MINNAMNADEIVRALKEMLPPQLDYAELVCAEGFAHGQCYVWEDPEPYQISAAIDLIASLQAQLAELRKECDIADAANTALHGALEEAQRRERAAVEDMSTYKDCGFCAHLQDQQYCYKNCQRHVDVDNFRTYPCWQWRGPQEAKKGETE